MTAFTPTDEWQDVPDGAVLPPGCVIEMNLETGRKQARIDGPPPPNGNGHGLKATFAEQWQRQEPKPEREAKPEAPARAQPEFPPLLTGEEFKAGLVLKKPLIREWDLKPGNLYSLTAPTGGAKTAIALAEAYALALEGRRVVYLVGENADDVRARAILMEAKLGLKATPPTLRFVADAFDLGKGFDHIAAEVEKMDGADLIFVDTSPAFQSASGGKEENNNNEQIAWARHLRELTRLKSRPAVVALCHPPKYPNSITDCVPRGGGAFLAEVDGNYVSWPESGDPRGDALYFRLSWTGKFRGRFEPLVYRTEVASCDQLRDEDGHPVKSVWGERARQSEVEQSKADQVKDEDAVLSVMSTYPDQSFSVWAQRLGWMMPSGPAKYRVEREIKQLSKDRLVEQTRGSGYRLTKSGEKAAAELRASGNLPAFCPSGAELAEGLSQGKTTCV
jgi:AAA domain